MKTTLRLLIALVIGVSIASANIAVTAVQSSQARTDLPDPFPWPGKLVPSNQAPTDVPDPFPWPGK